MTRPLPKPSMGKSRAGDMPRRPVYKEKSLSLKRALAGARKKSGARRKNVARRRGERADSPVDGLILRVAKLRPYFGIGFGRSVPRKRVGFQFDVGVWYHGTPELSSSYETAYDPDADALFADISLLDRLVLYPQVTLRLTYKIF